MNDSIRMRLQILYDAFQTTKLDHVHIRPGVYLEGKSALGVRSWDALEVESAFRNNRECCMCMLGALVLKQLTKTATSELEQLEFDSGWQADELKPYFDAETLAVAEALFEQRVVRAVSLVFWEVNRPLAERVDRLARELPSLGHTLRAQAILQHLIENEGVFNLDQLQDKWWSCCPDVLSDESKAVLHRYGVLPLEQTLRPYVHLWCFEDTWRTSTAFYAVSPSTPGPRSNGTESPSRALTPCVR